jgi:hypothetical protein
MAQYVYRKIKETCEYNKIRYLMEPLCFIKFVYGNGFTFSRYQFQFNNSGSLQCVLHWMLKMVRPAGSSLLNQTLISFLFLISCSMIFYRLMRLNIFQWKTISFKKQYLIDYVVVL